MACIYISGKDKCVGQRINRSGVARDYSGRHLTAKGQNERFFVGRDGTVLHPNVVVITRIQTDRTVHQKS